MSWRLRDLESGKVYPLTGLLKQIGRSPEADIIISDPRVSRFHARLERSSSGWVLVDLESKNGTRVNQELVKEKELEEGDIIQIGLCQLVFEKDPERQPDEENTKVDLEKFDQ